MKIEMNEGAVLASLFFALAIVACAMFWAVRADEQGKAQIEVKKLELAIAQYSAEKR